MCDTWHHRDGSLKQQAHRCALHSLHAMQIRERALPSTDGRAAPQPLCRPNSARAMQPLHTPCSGMYLQRLLTCVCTSDLLNEGAGR